MDKLNLFQATIDGNMFFGSQKPSMKDGYSVTY